MRKPDLVGTAEAAEILGVEVPRVSRYRKNGKMPPSVADLAATSVWMRKDVEHLATNRNYSTWTRRVPLSLAGTSEAASLLGVDKAQVGRWRRNGKFPRPTWQFSAGPVWWEDDIVHWVPPSRRHSE